MGMAVLMDSGILTCGIQGLDCEGFFSIPTDKSLMLFITVVNAFSYRRATYLVSPDMKYLTNI